MARTYNVRNLVTAGSCWLYDWADDQLTGRGPQSIPVWTHDRDKALVFSAYDAALAVAKVRGAGIQADRVSTDRA